MKIISVLFLLLTTVMVAATVDFSDEDLRAKVAERFDRRKKALELGAVIEKIVRAKKGG